jgi:hypothetical protein
MATKAPVTAAADDRDPDFQFALKALLGAYQPILEQELARSKDPEALEKEAEAHPANCEDEITQTSQILDRFFTEEVAVRLLPAEARELLGPVERWRWCLLHIRCCIIFGWLLCRRPRNFRLFVYYLHRYWLCVRQAIGAPIANPPTAHDRADFQVLVKAAAAAYRPFLTDQLATVDFPLGLPEEVLAGKIDCNSGEEEASAIFERLLTVDAAHALLGAKAFEQHSKDPFFWFCRCWCLCAIRFGCCLGRARRLVDVLRCLKFYRRCLRECFQPLRCDVTAPTGCAAEKPLATGGVGLEIVGTASGGMFDHYVLQWRKVQGQACDDNADWSSIGISYPGGGSVGSVQVGSGTLGWIETTTLAPDSFEIRLCVFPTGGGALCCFCKQFALFKVMVWIDHVAEAPINPTDPFDPDAVISGSAGEEVPVGCCVRVGGSAYVGDCSGRKIKCFDLRWGLGYLPGPTQPGFNPADYTGSLLLSGPVCYTDPDPVVESRKRAPWNQVIGVNATLTTALVDNIDIPSLGLHHLWKLQPTCYPSASQLPSGVTDSSGCPDPHHRCQSGKYTLLLDVTDTLGTHYYDTQHVFFDNKPMLSETHVFFGGIRGLPSCTDMHLTADGSAIPAGAPCGLPWPAVLEGIAYDEYVDETDTSFPSDNFDYYSLWITRQGGPSYSVPITPTLAPAIFGPDPLKGTSRVGQPGVRCEPLPSVAGCPPPPPIPARVTSPLTTLDLRIFDAVCVASLAAPFAPPAGFALERGTCCGYTFQLYAQDKTRTSSPPCHAAWSLPRAVCICNDLPVDRPAG